MSTLLPKLFWFKSRSYPDWLNPDGMWLHACSIHTAKFILLKHTCPASNLLQSWTTHLQLILIPYSGFLSWEKTFENFAFLWRFVKVFSVKIYFQAIRYRASGRGALGYHKFAKVFSTKETRYTLVVLSSLASR